MAGRQARPQGTLLIDSAIARTGVFVYGVCTLSIFRLDFPAGGATSLSLGEEPPHAAVGGAAIFFFAYSAGAAGAGRGAISCRVAGAIGGPIGPR